MKLRIAFLLATLSGFVALSYEILWFRVYSFLVWGRANAFGLLLAVYLAGIACGALLARRYCQGRREMGALALFLLVANLAGFLVIPAVAEASRYAAPGWSLLGFGFVAALLGTGLPLIAHFGIPPGEQVGARLSYLYMGNILGSAAGSLGTGFVLLDHFSLRTVSVVLVLLGLAMTGGAAMLAGWARRRTGFVWLLLGGCALLVLVAAPGLFASTYEKLTFKREYTAGRRFRDVVENRSGVVAATDEGTVYGGGVYDGKFSVDPVDDVNGIVRAYAVAALHAAPAEVCVVGLGSGSWAQVLAHHPAVSRVTVIEINPGYLELVGRAPAVSSLLANPKVETIVDDARRWLARTDRTFDAIVQNTTYHFRAHATNLLSREYLGICRGRLRPGGLMVYNTTWSKDAQRTGLEVFRRAWRVMNCMYVSDAPLAPDFARWRRILLDYAIDGRRMFDPARAEHRAGLERMTDPSRWADRATVERETRGHRVITDDNMATEWNLPGS